MLPYCHQPEGTSHFVPIDDASARALGSLNPALAQGSLLVFGSHDLAIGGGRPVIDGARHSLCVRLLGRYAPIVLAFDLTPGKNRLTLLSMRETGGKPLEPSTNPIHVHLEWEGETPACFQRALDTWLEISEPKLDYLGSQLTSIFWNQFSPSLQRTFLSPHWQHHAIYEDESGHRTVMPERATGQVLSTSRANPKAIIAALEAMILAAEQTPAHPLRFRYHGDVDYAAFIELRPRPLIASAYAFQPAVENAIRELIASSGLRGMEIRGHIGNRAGDDVYGPAIIRIVNRPRSTTGHEAIARAAELHNMLTQCAGSPSSMHG